MANTVTIRTLIDGPRQSVLHVYLKSDGMSGDIVDQVVVDISALNSRAVKTTLEEVWYNLVGFDALLEFDSPTDTTAWKLSSGTDNHQDFRSFGGIKDSNESTSTGDVLITTNGMTTTSDEGTIILKVRKDF